MSYVKEVITIERIYIALVSVLCISLCGISVLKLMSIDPATESGDYVATFSPHSEQNKAGSDSASIRAVWINYNEISANENDAKKYRKKVDSMFKSIKNANLNIAFVQVRAFNDAFYESKYFPKTKFICNGNANFDALEIICDVAKNYGVSVHAWINPYRVSYDTSVSSTDLMLKTNSGVFYDPGNSEARALILNGVKELISKYDIDGIHIDDYFYPADIGSADAASYAAYKDGGGTLTTDAWRRSNVNTLLRYIYDSLKSVDDSLIFSVSPSADVNKNYSSYYADVYSWCGNKGYADWIIPQVYFGYQNQSLPFSSTVTTWEGLVKNKAVKLIIGIPGYKIGEVDEYAGTGKNEFIDNGAEVIKRQISETESRDSCYGYAIYSYSSIEKLYD